MAIRRNAKDLTNDERDRFINALHTLKTTVPAGSQTNIYDQFVAIHLGVASLFFSPQTLGGNVPGAAQGTAAGTDGAHRGPAFLPWHREFLLRLEGELQNVDSRVTLPYWEWTDQKASEEIIFKDDFMGPRGGDGTNPAPITTGNFNNANWPVNEQLHLRRLPNGTVVQMGNTLLRNLQPFPHLPNRDYISHSLRIRSYVGFRPVLEQFPLHNWIHPWVGGSMTVMTSPNDPIFFMHHANVDRLWAAWQETRRDEWEATHDTQYSYSTHYRPGYTASYGHNLGDLMWPWDGGQTTPATFVENQTQETLRPFFLPSNVNLPQIPPEDLRRTSDVLDHVSLGFGYDNLEDALRIL
jgi:tyrosinase